MDTRFAVVIGLDVGKSSHHACALDADWNRYSTSPWSRTKRSSGSCCTKTAAQILLNIGDGSAFETPGHLAAHAGIAPVTRRSGTSIRGEFPARSGNKRLKNALFYSA